MFKKNSTFRRKLKAIKAIIFCEKYFLATEKDNCLAVEHTMSERNTMHVCDFTKSFIADGGIPSYNNMKAAQQIINDIQRN